MDTPKTPPIKHHALYLIGAAFLAITAFVYWHGLRGPIVFDDYWNLAPISRWHAGEQAWFSAMFPNADSLVYSRPVAMASFMLTSWLFGDSVFGLKLGNLVLHLACGLVGFGLMRRAFSFDPSLRVHAGAIALVTVAIWLIHPLHVSTVLYGVQRMAQLSTFFSLAAALAYLSARGAMVRGRRRAAMIHLWTLFPLLLVAGILSKQNAAIAGFLCLVLELAYFSRPSRDAAIRIFHSVFVGLPVAAVVLILSLRPERLLAGYADAEFTLWQRLLTQPRVLVDYLGMWLVPRGPRMGLYTDDFPVSSGLLSPATTLLAGALLVALSCLAIAVRKRSPSIFAGWFFFLVAHGVESSFLPLEMYYEHRNYMPAIGLMICIAGILVFSKEAISRDLAVRRNLIVAIGIAIYATLAFSTYARALVWQSEASMVAQGLRHHPNSIRLRLDGAALALRENRLEDARDIVRPMLDSEDGRQRLIGRMDLFAIECVAGTEPDPAELQMAARNAQSVYTVNEVFIAILFETINRNGKCPHVAPETLADAIFATLEAAHTQPDHAPNKVTARRLTAQLYARGGQWEKARSEGERGWNAMPTLPLGSILVRTYATLGEKDLAMRTLDEVETMVRPADTHWHAEVAQLREIVDSLP